MSALRRSVAFPIVISGPSGAGKTTLVNRLVALDDQLVESVSTTTRAPRAGEVAGRDYYFVGREEFNRMKETELVEWAEVHGEGYGTPRHFVESSIAAGKDVVLNIDIQGGYSVKKVFPGVVSVFILPPSFATLEERIKTRGDVTGDALRIRLENARTEITSSVNYDYIVVNDTIDQAVDDLRVIISAERARSSRLKPGHLEGFYGKQE